MLPLRVFEKIKAQRKIVCKWCGKDFYTERGGRVFYCVDHKLKEYRYERERKK